MVTIPFARIALAAACLAGARQSAADLTCVDFASTSHWVARIPTADAQDVHVAGNLAYVADGTNGLRIWDIESLDHSVELGSFPASQAFKVTVAGTLAYLINWATRELLIVDVSVPSAPELVGSYNAGDALGITVSGSVVYLATTSGLRTVDVSNPEVPLGLGFLATSAALNVVLAGNTAFVPTVSGLTIVDVSNPADPVFLGNGPTSQATGVTVSGSMAYVSTAYDGLVIFDISSLGDPQVVGSAPATGIFGDGILLEGSLAFMLQESGGVQVIDASNPTAPHTIDNVEFPFYAESMSRDDSRAYISAGDMGVSVVELKSTPGVAPVASVGNVLDGSALGLAVVGTKCYVADQRALQVIDVSAPAEPSLLGALSLGGANGVDVLGERAYVTENTRFDIIDVSTPGSPSMLGSLSLPNRASWPLAHGEHVFVANSVNGVRVIDVSSEASPTIAATLPIPWANHLARSGDRLYVTTDDGNLDIVDVSNHVLPVILGEHVFPYSASAVAVQGSLAYVGAYPMVYVVDVADPAAPGVVGEVEIPFLPRKIHASGPHLYVANGEEVLILDVEDPASPAILGAVACVSPSNMTDVVAVDAALYVAAAQGGLLIYPAQCATTTDVETKTPFRSSIAAWPNPASGRVSLRYDAPGARAVELVICDVRGRLIRTLAARPVSGAGSVVWDGLDGERRPVPTGVYYARLIGSGSSARTQLTILR